jgi:hypothetical protein
MIEQLIKAGNKLPESHRPPIGDISALLAGLIYWVENGNLDVPEPTPEQQAPSAEQGRISELEAELAAAQANEAGQAVPAPAISPGAGAPEQVDPAAAEQPPASA